MNEQQAILARDMIDMIRHYPDNAGVLSYLESFASSIALLLDDKSIVNWYDIAGVCDQRYYSLNQGKPIPLNTTLLDECEKRLKPYLPSWDTDAGLSSMSTLQDIVVRLNEIIEMEGKESLDQLGSYIVGTLIVDEVGWTLYETNETVQRIADLGADIETGKSEDEWVQEGWKEIKDLVSKLNTEHKITYPNV